MIVTFVSECQGRAIHETRRVLDAYAHRIGIRTWQTVITEQGLDAVRSRLASRARKNTAVACHRAHGNRNIELLWIVGNRRRFDHGGRVAVHRTERDLIREDDENNWHYLPLMRALVGVSALFHDFGKAWDPFQRFLRADAKDDRHRDPWRHEWVSTLLFRAAVAELGPRDFAVLLTQLVDRHDLRRELSDCWIAAAGRWAEPRFRLSCSEFAWRQWIEWLIVSHHRLPARDPAKMQAGLRTTADVFSQVSVRDDFEKQGTKFDVEKHWKFEHGLPVVSDAWCEQARIVGRQLAQWLNVHGDAELKVTGDFVRPMLLLSRMALMVGDHEFSSLPKSNWSSSFPPVANTIKRANVPKVATFSLSQTGQARQYLDEHLIGVARQADRMLKLLPAFECELAWIERCRPLRKPSQGRFVWQNKAVAEIRKWHQMGNRERCGFFGINMASTGCGKTLANARIMDALQDDQLRFSLALGLRTLTLQTGRQYQERLRLHSSELAVLIGSAAIAELERQNSSDQQPQHADAGAESMEDLAGSLHVEFEGPIPDDEITTVMHSSKARQLLKAPLLVCTIDHLMPASEGTRGNSQPLPLLRMLSSDLVIDEVDDFDVLDIPAIARLVHLAGMLGRRVLLSSATVAPSIAEGLFQAYWDGWQHHAAFRHIRVSVSAFWADEFGAEVRDIDSSSVYPAAHQQFVDRRIKKLTQHVEVRQKATLCPIEYEDTSIPDESEEQTRLAQWHRSIADEVFRMHRRHAWYDKPSQKWTSIGVVRVANVEPCVDLAEYLMRCEVPPEYEVRVVCYHARQVLLLRSEVERHLDRLLKREKNWYPADDPVVAPFLRRSTATDVVFVVVATPVAETGRDHDYDWAVVEPSSVRSIIQMGGRVRRHRDGLAAEESPNVALMDFNRRAFVLQSEAAFKWPGFEGLEAARGDRIFLESHQLADLVDIPSWSERLDAMPRIRENTPLAPTRHLADLEHQVMRSVLTDDNLGAAFVQGGCKGAYWLTDVAQRASRFRTSHPQSVHCLYVEQDGELKFRVHEPYYSPAARDLPKDQGNIEICRLDESLLQRVWMPLDYSSLLDDQARRTGRQHLQLCRDFGELRLEDKKGEVKFTWIPELGARKSER